jgi:GAF domain-containing protein
MSDSAGQRRLSRVCEAAVIALDADGAAATLMAEAGPILAHATDPTSGHLEREQQTCGEGPSWSAFALQAPVIIEDVRGDDARQAWPLLADALAPIDVGRVLALPVRVGGIKLGVLSIYNRLPGAVSPGQLPAAMLAADTAGLALLDSESGSADAAPLSELGPVLDYRIHQATGMVMGQSGLDAHDALTRLRAKAFSESVPLQRLALDVIARRVRFDAENR